ncbi:glycoside hydrolase family 3 protein [Lentzea jiangxiensis]|uniref:Exo-alpha-(1->6)-L-arabinopyranosidase n=1 Tax=Lentzea jiangxiensis TaxID=641025 RepID=A0A1H0IP52_9PSEU|nr:glycoside hydrolase family 3 protein [Lentzea jiangxiensis]SDO33155.1 beta-glucosidase [Lentzea jiangxiensis]
MGFEHDPGADRPPFRDPALPTRKRIDDLLGRLALDERIAMLHQYSPAVPRLGVAAFRTGTEALHGVAWLGPATVFPQAVGLGATWDPELVRRVAEAVSVELRAFHYHRFPAVGTGRNSLQAWAPVLNLLRDPRWGRNEEGYSEDPLHTAELGTAFCRGLAGEDDRFLRAAPVLKHFLAYNNENDRCVTSSGLRPRVLHEYDLAAFRPVIASGAATGVMAAYNLVNGRPCHVTPLLADELRRWTDQELFVVSDAEAPSNLVSEEHYFDDHAESHAAALKAGIDSFTDHGEDSATPLGRLREALERGLIDESDVDRAVRRQLEVRFRLGEFDPDLDPYAAIGPEVIDCQEHRALALRAATESVVLLRNTGLLPLAAPKIAVIGPLADTVCEDWYSGTLPYQVSVASGLSAVHGGEVTVSDGADRVALRSRTSGALLGKTAFDVVDWGDGVLTLRSAETGRYLSLHDTALVADQKLIKSWDVRETFRLVPVEDSVLLQNVLTGRYAVVDPVDGRVSVTAESADAAERWEREVLRDGTEEALAAALAADVAVVVLGNHPLIHGRETEDRTGIALPSPQDALLRAVAGVRPDTVLVVMSSYPYALDWADANLPAVVWTSHGGQETGRAVAAVLLGEADPAGRLPQTWYRGDDPLPHPLDYDVIKAGWTYQYHRADPLYPFGHGLSYAEFELHDLVLSSASLPQDGAVDVSVAVTNTGERTGSEVVQVYVRALDARYEAPLLRLAGFGKVSLAPGGSEVVTVRLSGQLSHWDVTTGAFTVDPGDYEVLVARSARDVVLTAPLTVTGPAPGPRPGVDRRLLAADFDDHDRATLVDATRTTGDAVTAADPSTPATLVFRSTHLAGAHSVEVEVAGEDDGRLEFRSGSAPLAAIGVPATGDRHAWTTMSLALPAPLEGVHDLRVVLHGGVRLAAFRFRTG